MQSNTIPWRKFGHGHRRDPRAWSPAERDQIMEDAKTMPVKDVLARYEMSASCFNTIREEYLSLLNVRAARRKRTGDLLPPERVRELLGPGGRYHGGAR